MSRELSPSPAVDDAPSAWLGGMRIFFTGGSGKAGHHVAPYLAAQGHQVTNADLTPLGHSDVTDLRVDLTDAGETYSAMAGVPTMDDFDDPDLDLTHGSAYDAVVHFAAIPATLVAPDSTTFATNILAHYNVLEAATRLGIRKIVFASSETTYGVCFGQGERKPLYVPVDEEHPVVPEDSYAMSKVAGEVTVAPPSKPERGPTSTACASTTSSSPTSTPRCSRPSSRTRRCADATCSPTSTPATWASSRSGASRPTDSASRSSTSPTPTCQSPRPRKRSSNGSTTASRCAARWIATRPSTASTRPAACSATSRSTPGATSFPTRAASRD